MRTAARIQVRVRAAQQSFAAQTMAAMQAANPSAPMWSSELGTPAYAGVASLNTAVGYNGSASAAPTFIPFNSPNSPGNITSLMYWTGRAEYTVARGGEWWFVAGLTGSQPGSQAAVRYSVAANEFRHWHGPTYNATTETVFGDYGGPHQFDTVCMANDKLYRFVAHQNGTGAANWTLGEFDCATKIGAAIASSNGYGADDYRGTEYFPELNRIMIRRNQSSQAWGTFDLATRTFSTIANAQFWEDPGMCYHNGYVYLFSGASTQTFHRLTPAGTLETRAAPPVVMKARSDAVATQTILISLGSYIYAFVNRNIYRYDPAGDAWSGVYDTFPWGDNGAQEAHFTVGALSDIGCALFVRCITDFQHQAIFWKP